MAGNNNAGGSSELKKHVSWGVGVKGQGISLFDCRAECLNEALFHIQKGNIKQFWDCCRKTYTSRKAWTHNGRSGYRSVSRYYLTAKDLPVFLYQAAISGQHELFIKLLDKGARFYQSHSYFKHNGLGSCVFNAFQKWRFRNPSEPEISKHFDIFYVRNILERSNPTSADKKIFAVLKLYPENTQVGKSLRASVKELLISKCNDAGLLKQFDAVFNFNYKDFTQRESLPHGKDLALFILSKQVDCVEAAESIEKRLNTLIKSVAGDCRVLNLNHCTRWAQQLYRLTTDIDNIKVDQLGGHLISILNNLRDAYNAIIVEPTGLRQTFFGIPNASTSAKKIKLLITEIQLKIPVPSAMEITLDDKGRIDFSIDDWLQDLLNKLQSQSRNVAPGLAG